jgi:hypothetical protein
LSPEFGLDAHNLFFGGGIFFCKYHDDDGDVRSNQGACPGCLFHRSSCAFSSDDGDEDGRCSQAFLLLRRRFAARRSSLLLRFVFDLAPPDFLRSRASSLLLGDSPPSLAFGSSSTCHRHHQWNQNIGSIRSRNQTVRARVQVAPELTEEAGAAHLHRRLSSLEEIQGGLPFSEPTDTFSILPVHTACCSFWGAAARVRLVGVPTTVAAAAETTTTVSTTPVLGRSSSNSPAQPSPVRPSDCICRLSRSCRKGAATQCWSRP